MKFIAKVILIIFVFCIILLNSCTNKNLLVKDDSDITAYRKSQEDNIRETVFYYKFKQAVSRFSLQNNDVVYFISFGGRRQDKYEEIDPSDSFMERFKTNIPAVKKVSQCKINELLRVEDKDTGKTGVIFRVNDITWLNDSEVLAEGNSFLDSLAGWGSTYRLILKDKKWLMIEEIPRWDS